MKLVTYPTQSSADQNSKIEFPDEPTFLHIINILMVPQLVRAHLWTLEMLIGIPKMIQELLPERNFFRNIVWIVDRFTRLDDNGALSLGSRLHGVTIKR